MGDRSAAKFDPPPEGSNHALVVLSLTDGLRGGFEWSDAGLRKYHASDRAELLGRSPSSIRQAVIDHVRSHGHTAVEEVVETRDEYKDEHSHYYKVILPDANFKRGVFVEVLLVDADDKECPRTEIVSVHRQYT